MQTPRPYDKQKRGCTQVVTAGLWNSSRALETLFGYRQGFEQVAGDCVCSFFHNPLQCGYSVDWDTIENVFNYFATEYVR